MSQSGSMRFLLVSVGFALFFGSVAVALSHELNGTQWIQINFTAARAAGVTNFDFVMGSTTDTEAWRVFGSNSATSLGVQIFAGTDEGVTHTFTGANDAFTFYNFQATNGNVLLQQVSGVTAVPEPATWGMMLLGFLGLGFAFRAVTTQDVVRLNHGPHEG